jgi:hypothetical protein
MQGRWIDPDEPSSELIVEGGEVTCFGQVVDYDHKEIDQVDGVLTVSLGVDDETRQDAFARANVIGLAVTPEGELHAYNVKFAVQFVRPSS